MGKELSFFTYYKGEENRVTNYCGLLLKMLYQENPSSFAEVISLLLGENEQISVDTVFEQQKRSGNSVPDLCIRQESFTILFEVKCTNWFYSSQIEKHLKGLQKADKMVLFLLSNFEGDDFSKLFAKERAKANADNFIVQPISFELFVNAFENVKTSSVISDK